jgi:hypothetical protein
MTAGRGGCGGSSRRVQVRRGAAGTRRGEGHRAGGSRPRRGDFGAGASARRVAAVARNQLRSGSGAALVDSAAVWSSSRLAELLGVQFFQSSTIRMFSSSIRAPCTLILANSVSISRMSSAVSSTSMAPRFSSRWSDRRVPGWGRSTASAPGAMPGRSGQALPPSARSRCPAPRTSRGRRSARDRAPRSSTPSGRPRPAGRRALDGWSSRRPRTDPK